MKKLFLSALVYLLGINFSNGQNTWPFYEKQQFRKQCVDELKVDTDLSHVFSENMLISICICVTNKWEYDYDWETFAYISTAPLTAEVRAKFFQNSYTCAMQVMEKYKV
tara:strand:+ start:238 stop:564 length:327 start_codon:yes stop_codon:yes gene_type:complete